MANVYKNIQATISEAATDVDMYTSPDATTSVIKTLRLFNTHSGNLVVDISWDKITVNTDDSENLLTYNNILILEAGDILKMQTPTTDVMNMTAAVLQISR